MKQAKLCLYGDRVEISFPDGERTFEFCEANLTVLGRNKLNIYYGDKIYQIKGDKRFNALKYVHISHRSENIRKEEQDGKSLFLGL